MSDCFDDSDSDRDSSPEDDLGPGDGAARVPLSEAIAAVLTELEGTVADLQAIRHRLLNQELPDELKDLGAEEKDLPRPAEHARKIAADLETYATAIRNASGQKGDRPGRSG